MVSLASTASVRNGTTSATGIVNFFFINIFVWVYKKKLKFSLHRHHRHLEYQQRRLCSVVHPHQ